MDRLLTSRGLTRKAASDAAGVDYDWLRRAVSRGIAWPDKRSEASLKKLADALGLDDWKRLWSADFHVKEGSHWIESEAARLAEVMRAFAKEVGLGHPKLKAVLRQMGGTRLSLRLKQAGPDARAEPARPVTLQEKLAGANEFGSPATATRQALQKWGRTLDEYKKIGLPLLDYAALEPDVIEDHAELLGLDDPEELCRYVGRVYWLGQYAVLQGMTPAQAIEFIEGKGGHVPPGPSLVKDGRPEQACPATSGAGDGPTTFPVGQDRPANDGSYSKTARQALNLLDQSLQRYRAAGLPRMGEVRLSVEVVAMHAELHSWAKPEDLLWYLGRMIWLPEYARLLGKTPQEAKRFIEDHLARQAGGDSQDGRATTPGGSQAERAPGDDEVRARAVAKGLVGRVLGELTPEQAEHYLRGYPSLARAEAYLEGELSRLLLGTASSTRGMVPPQAPDEAVRSVVAEIVKDYEKSRDDQDEGLADIPADEQEALVVPTRPLEARHGDDLTGGEFDPAGLGLMAGTAPEAEVARSLAEDGEGAERGVDDLLAPLEELPLPGGGGTYLDDIKRLGTPRAVAAVALRRCGGDVGKALAWIIQEVDKARSGQTPRVAAAGRSEIARGGGEAPSQADRRKKKRAPAKVRTEDIREAVLRCHGLGMSVAEIIVDLRSDMDMPDRVRGAKQAELRRKILEIIARSESDEGEEDAHDRFDAQAQDDKRRWEVDEEDRPGVR